MAFPSYQGKCVGKLDSSNVGGFYDLLEAKGLTGLDRIGAYAICTMPEGKWFTMRESDGSLALKCHTLLMCWAPYLYNDQEPSGAFTHLALYREGESECEGTRASWKWNGNEEHPTLHPSIGLGPYATDPNRGWHGYLQAGFWQGV